MWSRESGRAICSGEDRITKTRALLLQSVEEPARPDEFRGQNAKGQNNRQPARTRRDDHDHADGEECEAEDDSEDPLGLLERLDHHLFFFDFLADSIALLIRDRFSYRV